MVVDFGHGFLGPQAIETIAGAFHREHWVNAFASVAARRFWGTGWTQAGTG